MALMNNDKHILIVEDNPDHLELTVVTLEEQRIRARIVVARDGVEALEYLLGQGRYLNRDLSEQPCLILLDMKLPKMSGLDVLRRVRGQPQTALIPVVMLTSSTEKSDLLACYQSGANGFVRKPVDFAAFTARLNCLQAYWIDVNESLEGKG